jgi:hypothetical protein
MSELRTTAGHHVSPSRHINIPTEHIDTFLGAMGAAAVEGFVRWVHGPWESETPKRFCKDCRYLANWGGSSFSPFRMHVVTDDGGKTCGAKKKLDPIRGETTDWRDSREVNKDFDCPDFEVKPPPEPPIPFEEPKPPARPVWELWGVEAHPTTWIVAAIVLAAVLLALALVLARPEMP